jgi:hypothetical protein
MSWTWCWGFAFEACSVFIINDVMTLPQHLPFHHPVVRDLAWVMASPNLISSAPAGAGLVDDVWCLHSYQQQRQRLAALDTDPQPLLHWLIERQIRGNSHRLGVYFESLVGFWLHFLLGAAPVHQNVPVYGHDADQRRQTQGEFDFLFAMPGFASWQHWEVAVKFYLCHRNSTGEVRWIGPGAHDRLDIKLARLFGHQLKLATSEPGQHTLQTLGVDSIQSLAWVKGYLFYPPSLADHTSLAAFETAQGISPRHLSGWWIRQGESPLPMTTSLSRWWPLPKRRWLSSALITEAEHRELLSLQQINELCATHFDGSQRSLLLAEMAYEAGSWREISRGFVVCPQWPDI